MNNQIFLKFTDIMKISDVFRVVFFTSVFMGTLSFMIIKKRNCTLKRRIASRTVEIAFLASTYEMLTHLSVIHQRLKLALSTFVGLIHQYPKYQKIYITETGDAGLKNSKIVEWIYTMKKEDYIYSDDFLFQHIYQTLESTKGIMVNPIPKFVIISWIIIFFIILIIKLNKRKKAEAIILMDVAILTGCLFVNCGLFIGAVTMISVRWILLKMFSFEE